MKLIMAVSSEGKFAESPTDDMRWTGLLDKKLFRLLTTIGGICFVGSATRNCMPPELPGRRLITLTRNPRLYQMQKPGLEAVTTSQAIAFDNTQSGSTWCLGGPTVARELLLVGAITEVHFLAHMKNGVSPVTWGETGEAQKSAYDIGPVLLIMKAGGFYLANKTTFANQGLHHTCWRSSSLSDLPLSG